MAKLPASPDDGYRVSVRPRDLSPQVARRRAPRGHLQRKAKAASLPPHSKAVATATALHRQAPGPPLLCFSRRPFRVRCPGTALACRGQDDGGGIFAARATSGTVGRRPASPRGYAEASRARGAASGGKPKRRRCRRSPKRSPRRPHYTGRPPARHSPVSSGAM